MSPYNYAENDPIRKFDPDGGSTHTSNNGTVIAIRNDKDLGVYRHNGDEYSSFIEVAKNYNLENTGAGGQRMGETWLPFGFADFESYEKGLPSIPGEDVTIGKGARINFSPEAKYIQNMLTTIIKWSSSLDHSFLLYGIKAQKGNIFDIKAEGKNLFGSVYYGEAVFGKFASIRDGGNMGAGIAAQKSLLPNAFVDYLFGKYNMCNDKAGASVNAVLNDVSNIMSTDPMKIFNGTSSVINTIKNGENKLSKMGIDKGKEIEKAQMYEPYIGPK